jgi:hypothetical protein
MKSTGCFLGFFGVLIAAGCTVNAQNGEDAADEQSFDCMAGNYGFKAYAVDSEQLSPGFVAVGDLDRDGAKEIVVTTLMEQVIPAPYGPPKTRGAVHIYDRARRRSPLDQWTERVPFGTDRGLGFINMPQIEDFNGDGQKDIAINTGFLMTGGGSQQYLVGPDFTEAVPFVAESAASPFFFHELQRTDLDRDGIKDVVTTRAQFIPPVAGPPVTNLAVDWYKHDGHGGYTKYTIDTGHCGSTIALYDVDKDADLDVVCPQFFGPPMAPSIVWLEQLAAPAQANAWLGSWQVHTIDSTTGLGFDIRFVDIDRDGHHELVYTNHNNQNNPALQGIASGVYAFEIPSDPRTATQWTKTTIDEGYLVTAPGSPASQGTPGLLDVGDLDGNGLLDVVTSGDGADGLFAILQEKRNVFRRVQVADGTMWGQAVIANVDGGKLPELVAVQHKYAVNGPLPAGSVQIFKYERIR